VGKLLCIKFARTEADTIAYMMKMEQRKVAIRKQPAIQSVSGLENKLKMEITNLEILVNFDYASSRGKGTYRLLLIDEESSYHGMLGV